MLRLGNAVEPDSRAGSRKGKAGGVAPAGFLPFGNNGFDLDNLPVRKWRKLWIKIRVR